MQTRERVWSAIILVVPILVGEGVDAQQIAPGRLSEARATPVSKPEARRRIATSPLTIFTNLSSESAGTRRQAYRELGIDSSLESLDLDDVRLEMSNLDADGDLEAILVYTLGRRITAAIVFDKSTDGWWQVGAFTYSWHWNSVSAARLIELREFVWPGRKDLLVRRESGGTGVVRTDLSVYRMHNGLLYRVFDTMESWQYDALGEQNFNSYLEKCDVTLYDQHTAGHPSIMVRHTRTGYSTDMSVRPKTDVVGCVAYAWHAVKFVFLFDAAITTRVCGADAKLPR